MRGATTEAGCNAIPGCLWSTASTAPSPASSRCSSASLHRRLRVFRDEEAGGKGAAAAAAGRDGDADPAQLPPNWTQVKDPNSGQSYYYNNATGVTQWTMPTA